MHHNPQAPASALHKAAGMARSFHHRDLDVPFAAQDVDAHVVLVADEQQIDGRPGHLQVVNPQLAQGGRQVRAGEADLPLRPVDPQAQAGLQQQEHRRRPPRPAAHRPPGRESAPRPGLAGSRRTAPASGAGRSTGRPRTAPSRSAAPCSPGRSGPGPGRSGRCRAARRSRCGRPSGCSAPRWRRACGRPSRRTTPAPAASGPPAGRARGWRCR